MHWVCLHCGHINEFLNCKKNYIPHIPLRMFAWNIDTFYIPFYLTGWKLISLSQYILVVLVRDLHCLQLFRQHCVELMQNLETVTVQICWFDFFVDMIQTALAGTWPSTGSGNRESIERRTVVKLYLPLSYTDKRNSSVIWRHISPQR